MWLSLKKRGSSMVRFYYGDANGNAYELSLCYAGKSRVDY